MTLTPSLSDLAPSSSDLDPSSFDLDPSSTCHQVNPSLQHIRHGSLTSATPTGVKETRSGVRRGQVRGHRGHGPGRAGQVSFIPQVMTGYQGNELILFNLFFNLFFMDKVGKLKGVLSHQ